MSKLCATFTSIPFVLGALLAGFTLGTLGCSGSDGNSGDTSSEQTTIYHGPEPYVVIELMSNGTFESTVAASPTAEATHGGSGTYERFANGFVELTTTELTGIGEITPVTAVALEAPGSALFLRPSFTGDIPVLLLAGTCPSTSNASNWALASCVDSHVRCDATVVAERWLGLLHNDPSSPPVNVPASYAVADGSQIAGGVSFPVPACTDGVIEVDSDTRIFLNDSGGVVVDTDLNVSSSSHRMVGFEARIADSTLIDGEFVGLLHDSTDDGSTQTVSASLEGGSVVSGAIFEVDLAALELATKGPSVAEISFSEINRIASTSEDGWLTGELDDGLGNIQPLYCTVDHDVAGSGRQLLFCVGQSLADPTERMNLVLLSQT